MSISTSEVPEVVYDALASPIGVLAGGANVIMQLSRLPVGHGVAGSKVETGRLDKHPIKRARTTFGYIAVAALGNDEERSWMRREVNRSHGPVHSEPDDQVAYNAFHEDLQLWVAACIYWGIDLVYRETYGEPDEATADALYRHAARFGTTLQVPESLWPADRKAFDAYWQEQLELVEMDDFTRGYLLGFHRVEFLPAAARWAVAPWQRFFNAGFLPAPFREELGVDWSPRDQKVFEAVLGLLKLGRVVPRGMRLLPWTLLMADFRRRMNSGRPYV